MGDVGCALAKPLHGIFKQSKESLTEDVVLKIRGYAQSNTILKGATDHMDKA